MTAIKAVSILRCCPQEEHDKLHRSLDDFVFGTCDWSEQDAFDEGRTRLLMGRCRACCSHVSFEISGATEGT